MVLSFLLKPLGASAIKHSDRIFNMMLLSRDDLPIEIDGAKKLSDDHIMLSKEGKLYISVTK